MRIRGQKITEMTNAETAAHLLKWCKELYHDKFGWPTDACGYDQHIKFVEHRNKNWRGNGAQEFNGFVKEYALMLESAQ